MYERSAVVLERYFAQSFYYNERNKLIHNFENYRRLIEVLERYQDVSEAEDKIIKECEDIASQIKQIQKNQSILYRKTLKLQEDRNSIFDNIDESAIELGKQLDRIEIEIDKNNSKMKPIDQEFIDTIGKFNDKSSIRSEHGKRRRTIEKEYRNVLEKTKRNIKEIDIEKISDIKDSLKSKNENIDIELKDIMMKNGEKEKEPFDSNVLECAIDFGKELYNQEGEILVEIYDKTRALLSEISNNAVKIKKHKKLSRDSKNKNDFLSVKKEYLTQFLDNERLSVGLGKKEHKKLMREPCNDFMKDIEQINNLNELLLGEIYGDIDNKKYEELYNSLYLIDLKNKDQEFERKLQKLNMVGQIVNPINWRIVSIEKIYNIFDEIVENEYQRDLTKYKIGNTFEIEDDEDLFDSDEEEPIKRETKKRKVLKIKKEPKIVIDDEIEDEIDDELEDDISDEFENINDDMSYYDNLDSDLDDIEENDNYFNDINKEKEADDDDDDDEQTIKPNITDEYDEYETIYPNYRKQLVKEDDSENKKPEKENRVKKDSFEENLYKTFYNDDDFYDDEEEDNVYEDLETILKNRRKRANRLKRTRSTKKKGIFGLGNKKW